MRSMALMTFLVALAPSIATADVVRHSSIPQAYWGKWSANGGTCADGDKAGIVLSAKAYVSPAGNCTVDFVSETAGEHGPTYSARLQCGKAAGGTQKKSVVNLIIRPEDGNQISVGPGFDRLTGYQRCGQGVGGAKP